MKLSDQTYSCGSTSTTVASHVQAHRRAAASPSLNIVRGRLPGLRRRRQLRKLLRYDDHVLADIGYNRGDLLRTLRLPANRQSTSTFDHLHSLQDMLPKSSRLPR